MLIDKIQGVENRGQKSKCVVLLVISIYERNKSGLFEQELLLFRIKYCYLKQKSNKTACFEQNLLLFRIKYCCLTQKKQ
jgi:hypothetical protein